MKPLLCVYMLLWVTAPLLALTGDVDGSGRVDGLDLIYLARYFGGTQGESVYSFQADLDSSGTVDGLDLSILAGNFGRSGQPRDVNAAFAPGQILVKFNPSTSHAQETLLARHNLRIMSTINHLGVHRVQVAYGQEQNMVSLLSAQPEVAWAELNLRRSLCYRPNDPYHPWQWYHFRSNLDRAWDVLNRASADIIVAVIDTGVAYEYFGNFSQAPDLQGTSFVSAYDFVDRDTHANDDKGHGTFVTGTIAQTTDNGIAVAGYAYGCTIMPLDVFFIDEEGEWFAWEADVAEAIVYATDNGAHIVNMSLGGDVFCQAEADAVAYAVAHDVVLVASAGNSADDEGWDPDTLGISYPAKHPGVIAVGACNYNNTRSVYSSYGDGLDLMAYVGQSDQDLNQDGNPDGVLQQTFQYPNYQSFDLYWGWGTSLAAPQVSGLAALIMSLGVPGSEVYSILVDTAVDLGPAGYDREFGYGRIDAAQAIYRASQDQGMGWAN